MNRNERVPIYRSKSIGRSIMENMYRYSIHGNVLPPRNYGIAREISSIRSIFRHPKYTHRKRNSPIPETRNARLPLLSRNKSVNINDPTTLNSCRQFPMRNSRNSGCAPLIVRSINKKCKIHINRCKIDECIKPQYELNSAVRNELNPKILIPIKLNQTINDDDDPSFITKVDWLVYLKPIPHKSNLCSISYQKYFV